VRQTGPMATGFRPGGWAALDAAVAATVSDVLVPGAVYLVAAGADVRVAQHGRLAIGGAPVRRDSIFRISSMTKPMLAATAMILVAEGALTLDEPVERLLPELADRRVLRRLDGPLDDTVAAERAITAHDLLTFTFGFGLAGEMFAAATPWPVVRAADELDLATLGPPEPDRAPAADEWIARFATLPLMAQPGRRWLYNTGSGVLGVLLERAAAQPLPEVMRTRLFEPLGMKDTAFWTDATERLATAYASGPNGLVATDEPRGAWSRPPKFADGEAGLVSTIDDVFRFAHQLRGGGAVLDADAVRTMTTGQLTAEQRAAGGFGSEFDDASWGYGLLVRDDGAFGWDGGLGSSMLIDPAHDLTTIVLTQRAFDSPQPPPIHAVVRNGALKALA
jgi:CubicO group peptidase (beta-lactamase class C family)